MVKVELSNEEIDMLIAAYEEKGIAACSLFLALDKEKQNIKVLYNELKDIIERVNELKTYRKENKLTGESTITFDNFADCISYFTEGIR